MDECILAEDNYNVVVEMDEVTAALTDGSWGGEIIRLRRKKKNAIPKTRAERVRAST